VWRPIRIKAPLGSVLNHTFPTSGASRSMLGQYLPAGVMQCLAQAVPGRVMGSPGSPVWSLYQSGVGKNGRTYANRYFLNGGFGANARLDGANVLSWPSNISNVPIEMIEHDAPYRIHAKRLRVGTGGRGARRGGVGQEMELEVLGSEPLQFRFNAERIRTPSDGVAGGEPGATGEISINGARIEDTKAVYTLKPGDRLRMATPGGGGYGDPRQRPRALAERDRDEGYMP
jgi:N-methylhydantoinase B